MSLYTVVKHSVIIVATTEKLVQTNVTITPFRFCFADSFRYSFYMVPCTVGQIRPLPLVFTALAVWRILTCSLNEHALP